MTPASFWCRSAVIMVNGHDTNRARDALHSIPPDLSRDEWVKAGMGFHVEGGAA
jgi:hypothetical protein